MSGKVHRPTRETELAELVAESYAARAPLQISGGGSKNAVGGSVAEATTVDMTSLSGITLYEPAELVFGAKAGTPLAEVEAALGAKGQMLAFEPADWRSLLGSGNTTPTIGGLVAANLSGPRRVASGACRDALIGIRFVNGLGEPIKSGGRVMKNVTGYDLVKLLAGSWGTLGIITEAIFKVLPKPEATTSLIWNGLDDDKAVALMSAALGSPFEVSGAAHLPPREGEAAQTCLRLETYAASLDYRAGRLAADLTGFGRAERLAAPDSEALWANIRDVVPLQHAEGAVWRILVAPSKAAAAVRGIRAATDCTLFYDWGGGLIWLAATETNEAALAIRAAAAAQGGHAMLVRAGEPFRAAHGVFADKAGALGALTSRIKAAFDPASILNPGRI